MREHKSNSSQPMWSSIENSVQLETNNLEKINPRKNEIILSFQRSKSGIQFSSMSNTVVTNKYETYQMNNSNSYNQSHNLNEELIVLSPDLEKIIGHDDFSQLHNILSQLTPNEQYEVQHLHCKTDLRDVFNTCDEEEQLFSSSPAEYAKEFQSDTCYSMSSTTDSDSNSNNSIADSCSDAEEYTCSLVGTPGTDIDGEECDRIEDDDLSQGSGYRAQKRQKRCAEVVVRGSRKKASKEAHEVLLRWVLTNRDNPYPSNVQKKGIAAQTGMSVPQVVHWMSNMRKRKLVPLLGKDKRVPRSKVDMSLLGK